MPYSIANVPLEVLRSIAKYAVQVDQRAPFRLGATCKRLRQSLHGDTLLWKQLVFAAFDFSVEGDVYKGFEECRLYSVGEPQLDAAREVFGEDSVDCERESEPPYLLEPPSWWRNLGKNGTFFRASQYGFLGDIQKGGEMTTWPECEDPITLYKDLLLLSLKVAVVTERVHVSSEGSGDTIPVLFSRPVSDTGICERTKGGHNKATLLQYLKATSYTPYVWARLANKKFSGGLSDHSTEDYDELTLNDVRAMEGFSSMTEVMGLNPNKGSDGCTPVFVVGKSGFSGRIVGFVGELVWT
ncbi:hypothetical protein BC830DRAFT_1156003 [Chytriomyces sp. MP71]|nr:hypothetical protein BC830DRAFT_1156003 [Chytriomyces sp. MP71]